MNTVDSKSVAIQFNECINGKDIDGLSSLMTEGHTFVDRNGHITAGKESMTNVWDNFFKSFPDYKNTFEIIKIQENIVVLYGYATWPKENDPDYAIWTATIEDDLVAEWRIYEDTEDNKKRFNLP